MRRFAALALIVAVIVGGTIVVKELWANAKYFDAQMLNVIWEADPAAISELLPAPLEPYEKPLVVAFIADFPRTNFGVTYKMAALNIFCTYKGELGTFNVSMPENSDMAVFGGREHLGFPKKMATLDFVKNGDEISGWVERHGIRFFEVRATLNHQMGFGPNQELIQKLFPNPMAIDATAFIIKGSMRADGKGVDYPPQLIRQVTQFRSTELEMADAQVTVKTSPFEPWWEKLKPVKVLGAMYTKGNNEMLPGEIIGTVPVESFMKDMGYSWDFPR